MPRCLIGLCWLAVLAPCWGEALEVPWARQTFSADEGCMWLQGGAAQGQPGGNAAFIAGPAPGQDWRAWLAAMREYRAATREHIWDTRDDEIALDFDGVRAWVRTARSWACAADLQPGEEFTFAGQGRRVAGNPQLCFAFDWCDRQAGLNGRWVGWSTVVATTDIPQDGAWHGFSVRLTVPPFDPECAWARPILGMDGTHDTTRGQVALRNLRLVVTQTPARAGAWDALRKALPARASFDDSLYRRHDLQWAARSFVCGFIMVYDRSFWDPQRGRYCVDELVDRAARDFGGYDSVVLWHAYPRIGADDRNQFDFFADMPGGLAGLREAVRRFHARGVKVFIPYNPWDGGTRPSGKSDEEMLAASVGALGADGVFLDTMLAAPAGLREAVDRVRPGVVFEPEGHPAPGELEQCNASWAQGLAQLPDIGVLRLKWLEQRHMQHQINRWDQSHQRELAAAWLNGSGMLVWENVFGTWNPWNAPDRATLRHMQAVWRACGELLAQGDWQPYFPTQAAGVLASCWEADGCRLWALVNRTGKATEAVLEVEDRGEDYYDAWRGTLLTPERRGGKVRLRVPLEDFGAVYATREAGAGLRELLARQRRNSLRPEASGGVDAHTQALSVMEPKAPPEATGAADIRGMLGVRGGTFSFTVRHQRRECGCYPDPGTPPERWREYLLGAPWDGTIEHHVTQTLADFRLDAQPVTNGEFEAFLRATGYAPRWGENLVRQWATSASALECPASMRDEPVVYVDLEDARAYARWAAKRLPTEWEWQLAAQQLGEAFRRGQVWEWTESERDDGHTRFVMLRGGSAYQAQGSGWYFPGGPQPVETHAKFLLMWPGLDRCGTIGFRCVAP